MTELFGFGRKNRLTSQDPEPGVGTQVTDGRGTLWERDSDLLEDRDLPWFTVHENRGGTWRGITKSGPVTVIRYVAP